MTTHAADMALATPPVAVGGLVLFGVALSNWALILTVVYTVFLLIDKAPVVIDRIKTFASWVKGL